VLARVVKPLKAKRLPFVIELPPYRAPRLRDVVPDDGDQDLVVPARGRHGDPGVHDRAVGAPVLPARAAGRRARLRRAGRRRARRRGQGRARARPRRRAAREQLRRALGHTIEPAIEPLGFDWKIGVGIIGAFAAREVFVSTLGVIHGVGDDEGSLRSTWPTSARPDGTPRYTPLVGLSLMVFFALACQCMSTLAVIKRETGGYRWPLFVFSYMTALAWVSSFLVFQLGSLLGY
jgi:ferrous iron transport protein B